MPKHEVSTNILKATVHDMDEYQALTTSDVTQLRFMSHSPQDSSFSKQVVIHALAFTWPMTTLVV